MNRLVRAFALLSCALVMTQGREVRAQWGYPGGFGMWGWEGWGASTAEGDLARGLGMFAQGAGIYNRQTAEADSINKDTIIRWNQYVYEAQQNADRFRAQRKTADRARIASLNDARIKRLRDNPDPGDIQRGAALNVALDEIDDPRVYVKALGAAKTKIGPDMIRHIPFNYASAAITYTIHELTEGPMPAGLMRAEFAADRAAIKSLGEQIDAEIEEGKQPDPETAKKLFAAIYAAEEKVASTLQRNSRERVEAERYLKAIHGLTGMLKTPAIDVILSGVDKRPNATLGELLSFMTAFNLRFGPATTQAQRDAYQRLYPMLVQVRNQIAPALAAAAPRPASTGGTSAVTDFFSRMSFDDLQKKAPKP